MTMKHMMVAIGLCGVLALPVTAQAPLPQPPAPAQGARDAGMFVNVRVDLTILDQFGTSAPARKTVSLYVADRSSASIRTSGRLLTKEGWRDVTINVDARPTLIRARDGSVQLDLGLEYRPIAPSQSASSGVMPSSIEMTAAPTGLNQRVVTILESGKPIIVSQAADPTSDRRISVELKATIEK
jgi:hypothetical protein